MPVKKKDGYGTVSQEARDYFSSLLPRFNGKTIPWSKEHQAKRSLLGELKAANLIEYDGRGQKKPTYIKALGSLEDAQVKRARGPRASVRTKVDIDVKRGLARWEDYFIATRPEAQRNYEQQRQSVTDAKILQAAKRLRDERGGLTLSQAVEQAESELAAPLETHLRRLFGDLMVDYLGVPEVGPDSR